ncbi:MAG: thioredoxin family protein [Paracoccaceae bacterium]
MKTVKVYGPGCKRCAATEQMIQDAASKLGVEIDLEKVTDPKSIALAGVMSTPGVSVDGKLVHTGGVPDAGKLERWLSA